MVMLGLFAIRRFGTWLVGNDIRAEPQSVGSRDLQTMRKRPTSWTWTPLSSAWRKPKSKHRYDRRRTDRRTKRMQSLRASCKAVKKPAQIREDSKNQLAALNDSVNPQLATKAAPKDRDRGTGQVAWCAPRWTTPRLKPERHQEQSSMARSELGHIIAKNHDEWRARQLGRNAITTGVTIDGRATKTRVGSVTITRRARPQRE